MSDEYTYHRVTGDAVVNLIDVNSQYLTYYAAQPTSALGGGRTGVDIEHPTFVAQEYFYGDSSGDVGEPIQIDQDNGIAYVCSYDRYSKIDLATGTILGKVDAATNGTYGMALNADGSRLYIAGAGDGVLRYIDTDTMTLNAATPNTVPNAVRFYGVAVAPNGTVYVVTEDEMVVRYSADLVRQADSFPIGSSSFNYKNAIVSPDGAWLATQSTDGDVVIFDLSDDSIVYDDNSPTPLAWDSTSTYLYGGDSIGFSRIDVETWGSTSYVIDLGEYPDSRIISVALATDERAYVLIGARGTGSYSPIYVALVLDIQGTPTVAPNSRSYLPVTWQNTFDGYTIGTGFGVSDKQLLVNRTLTGTVLVNDQPEKRRVVAYDKKSMLPVAETYSDATDGSYTMYTCCPDDLTVIAVGEGAELTQMYDLVGT